MVAGFAEVAVRKEILVAGACNHENLRLKSSRLIGTVDLHHALAQFSILAAVSLHLNLLFQSAA